MPTLSDGTGVRNSSLTYIYISMGVTRQAGASVKTTMVAHTRAQLQDAAALTVSTLMNRQYLENSTSYASVHDEYSSLPGTYRWDGTFTAHAFTNKIKRA
jgi:hypothetical protein